MNFTLDIFREILTGDIIARACRAKGLDAELVFIVDSSDLRRVYKFLDEEYEQYIGHRLSLIPPPTKMVSLITKHLKQVVLMPHTF